VDRGHQSCPRSTTWFRSARPRIGGSSFNYSRKRDDSSLSLLTLALEPVLERLGDDFALPQACTCAMHCELQSQLDWQMHRS
jgi:hypothetical protein